MLLTAAVCTEMPAPPTGRALLLGALKAGVLIVWDPDHLQAKRDGKGEVAMEEVERGRVVRVEMEDVASGLEWTQIGVYMPVRGQAKVTIAASGGTQDPETKDPAQDAWRV